MHAFTTYLYTCITFRRSSKQRYKTHATEQPVRLTRNYRGEIKRSFAHSHLSTGSWNGGTQLGLRPIFLANATQPFVSIEVDIKINTKPSSIGQIHRFQTLSRTISYVRLYSKYFSWNIYVMNFPVYYMMNFIIYKLYFI